MKLSSLLLELCERDPDSSNSVVDTRFVKLPSDSKNASMLIFAVSYTASLAAVALVDVAHSTYLNQDCDEDHFDEVGVPIFWQPEQSNGKGGKEDFITTCGLLTERDERIVVLLGMKSGMVLSYEFEIRVLYHSCSCNAEYYAIETDPTQVKTYNPLNFVLNEQGMVQEYTNGCIDTLFKAQISRIISYKGELYVNIIAHCCVLIDQMFCRLCLDQ